MSRVVWKPIKRGDEIPKGAILGGRTSTDGEVFVGKSKSGEVGKINLSGGRMWNLWSHSGGESQEADILLVSDDCPIQWVAVSKGNDLPPDAVQAGETSSDGAVYPCRRSGAVGKLNLDKGKVNNFWFHGDWFAKKDGEVLVVGPVGAGAEWAEQFKKSSSGEAHGIGAWIKDHKGALAIAATVAAAAGVGAGIYAASGSGKTGEGYTAEQPAEAPAPAPAAAATPEYHDDPKNYDANAMCEGITAGERVDWLCKEQGMSHDQAVKTVMKEFKDAFKHWLKPHADCGGVPAKQRVKWLTENKGMSVQDARKQVRSEFPDAFGASSPGHHVDGVLPHTLSLQDSPDGPKLQILVTPEKPEEVSLVAFHYQINQGQSMNFDVRESDDDTYVHMTPGGGGYPACPVGSEVSYWLYAIRNGIGEEMPGGAGGNPQLRMYWTAS